MTHKRPTKALIALGALLAFGTAAEARLAPNDKVVATAAAADDAVMYPGPIGATLEANYFHAAQPDFAGAQCRLRTYISAEHIRHARSCD
jgi:hypothetical protein